MMASAKMAAVIRAVSSWAPDVMMVAGAASVSCGVGMVYLPAGVIFGGLFLLGAGWLLARVK